MTPPIVKRYLIAFDKYKWIGLASFGLVVAGSMAVALQPQQSKYVANGALTYNRPTVSFSATGTEINLQGQELSRDILLSDQVIDAAAAKVNIPPIKIRPNIQLKMPEKDLKASDRQLTPMLIEVQYKDTDIQRSQDILQALMVSMIQLSAEINTRRLKAVISKVNERLPQAKKELQVAEQKLEVYDRKERPAILAAENGSLLNAVTNSQIQQRQVQLIVSGIDAQIRSIQEKLGLNVNQAYVSSALSADPIIANLRAQLYQTESQIEVFKKQGLRFEHPTMVQLQRQKEGYENLLRQRGAEVVGGEDGTAPLPAVVAIRSRSNLDPARQQLANQMVSLQTQRETLQQQFLDLTQEEAQLRKEYSLIPNKQLERSRLEQEVALKKAVYDQMQVKLTDARTAEAETVSSLGIARPPVVMDANKDRLSPPITVGIGSLLGLLVGSGVIFLLGSLEGIFKTKEDIRDSLKQREVPLLGELPLMPVDGLALGELPVVLSPESFYLESYEKFRSNLRRIGGRKLKVVLMTSTSSAEGKTVSAYNLGIASARAGKRTLIVEADLRSPSHCSSLRVTSDTAATLEPLQYYANLSECIRLVPDIENLYILPSPGPVRQSAAILESSEIRRLMEDVRERFDFVIIDTPPLSLSNDALLIQPYTDGIVLVTRPNYTQENMLAETIDQLVEFDLELLGVVINGTDITTTLAHSYIDPNSPPEQLQAQVTNGARR
ncbi:tyrosine-protein kinase domain-containing protein [Brasilonema sp. UFV-L1]|uniref:GumC family protein n=1 Tax=Brasilonema sp. UFV-L1 TaxID=2234130 RepID=UPI00145EADDF|nr:tyrosine-protein kinase domain-containing protein [Brasilonema sp. UFV-L1]NMG06659.1 lipopolysaccharide biosynthesis [Brasilonema sp. UFV-L1]